ncbi:MAG: helix-turn-helix domain-containing protein [Lachnospiraceae bacterium]|jgi:Predicted transcriptional regulators|nr:helix-turn-helix domain-containing protein [Lachnospiraceae bacterium]GFI48961.1 HTH-type transcriptional regulator ImmR [Lachnospiraceae bacterium]
MLGEKLAALRKRSGYSQQELAEKLSVTRQTISNWECGQGAPALDKAVELAKIYQISLDDLAGEQVEVVVKEKRESQARVLKRLVGKYVKIEDSDATLLIEQQGKVKVLEVSKDWIRVEYTRLKEGSFTKKETVVKLIDINAVEGFEIEEEDE